MLDLSVKWSISGINNSGRVDNPLKRNQWIYPIILWMGVIKIMTENENTLQIFKMSEKQFSLWRVLVEDELNLLNLYIYLRVHKILLEYSYENYKYKCKNTLTRETSEECAHIQPSFFRFTFKSWSNCFRLKRKQTNNQRKKQKKIMRGFLDVSTCSVIITLGPFMYWFEKPIPHQYLIHI